MLHRTNILALVGGGNNPKFSLNKVIIWDDLQGKVISELRSTTNVTKVKFKPMSDNEINWYIETGEWHGVAAGYRLQGLASCFIEEIQGSMSSVIGLPISNLYDMLNSQGYSILE